MHSRSKLLAIAVLAAVIAFTGLGIWVFGPCEKGGPDRVSMGLPEGIMLLAWTAPAGDILALANEMGLTSELLSKVDHEVGELTRKTGVDPLTTEGLNALGVDLDQALAFAVVPSPRSAGLGVLYIPLLSGKSGVAIAQEFLGKLGPKGGSSGEGEVRGNKVLWLHEGEGESSSGAVVEATNGAYIVFPLQHQRSDAAEISGEIAAFVDRLLDPEVPRLAEVPGYSRAVAGSGGSILGLYLNPAATREFLMKDDELAGLPVGLTDVKGASVHIKVEGNRVTATGRMIGPEGEDAATFTNRDRAVVDLIPGKAGFGLHLALSAEQVVAGFEKFIALEQWAWDEYQENKREAISALQLPDGTELHHLWDGEMGLFVSELTPSPELMIHSAVLFFGLADLGKAKAVVNAAARWAGKEHFTEEKIGTAMAWRIRTQGMTMGLMVHDGRLWFAGDLAALSAIEKGEVDSERSGERAQRLTRDMTEANGGAFYVDLATIMGHLPAILSNQTQEELKPIWPLLSKLDYLTWRGEVQGNVTTTRLALAVDSESVRELVVKTTAALLSQIGVK